MQIPLSLPRLFEDKPLVIWACILAFAMIAIKISFGILISDDAYITLSHVKTWLAHGRPVMSVYNPACGTSTPLYTILLYLLCKTGAVSPVIAAYGINAVLDFINIVLVYHVGRKVGLTPLFSASAASFFGLGVLTLAISATGMETILYITLITSALLLVASDKSPVITGTVLFLLAFIRPEGIVIALTVAATGLLRKVPLRRVLLMMGFALLGTLALLLFYHLAYGTMLPHSVLAKKVAMHTAAPKALTYWWQSLFFGGPDYTGRRGMLLGNFTGSAIGFVGCMMLPREKKRALMPIMIWPLLYVLFFVVTRSSHPYFTWYYLPVLPMVYITLGFGWQEVAGRIPNLRPERVGWLLLFLFCGIVVWRNFYGDKMYLKHQKVHREREALYQKAAAVISRTASPSTPTVMIEEVGTLGYYLPSRIIDLCGIISPEVLAMGLEENPEKFVRAFSPDWIIVLSPSSDTRPAHLAESYYTLQQVFPHFNHNYFLQLWKKGHAADALQNETLVPSE